MTNRRYTDDEVAAIFRAATEGSESRALPDASADGLTLTDLQSIAREVGISPDAVSRAALTLDRPRPPAAAARTFLGLPFGVERKVALERRLTDDEWELLVVELRETFQARGTMSGQGSLREWRNGNLQALLEPTPTGQQFRLRTYKGNARASLTAGTVALGTAAVVATGFAASGALAQQAPLVAGLAVLGGILVANATIGVRNWARLRRQQIDGIVERLLASQHDVRHDD